MVLITLFLLMDPDSIFSQVEMRTKMIEAMKGRMEVIVEYPKVETLIGRFYLKGDKLLLRFYSPAAQDFLFSDSSLAIYNPGLKEKIVKKGFSKINQPIPYLDVGPGILTWTKGWRFRTVARESILGHDLYIIEGISNDTTQVYRRSLFWVDAEQPLIRRVEFYDRDDLLHFIYLVRTEEQVGNAIIPKEYQLRILTEFGVLVISIVLSAIEKNPALPDSIFMIGG